MTNSPTPAALGTDQARTRLHELTVIDVRTPAEYTSGYADEMRSLAQSYGGVWPEITEHITETDVTATAAPAFREANIRELPLMDKVRASAAEAVADIPDGASLAVGGFGLSGVPEAAIRPCTSRARPASKSCRTTAASTGGGWACC
ncbi:rhodanese-related sulfurtransferase [Streptomyces sp. B4I13]|nr:rhodanese-related sulfurtransferase [Streptomyces sp. B4I13]